MTSEVLRICFVAAVGALALSGCASVSSNLGPDLATTYTDVQALDNSPPAIKVKADVATDIADLKAPPK